LEGCLVDGVWSARFNGKEAASGVVIDTCLPAWKPLDIGVFLVVKVRPPKAGIFPAKCARLHKPEIRPGVCAHPDDVAGILRDAWVDEDDSERG
jgi:hypothetical protein